MFLLRFLLATAIFSLAACTGTKSSIKAKDIVKSKIDPGMAEKIKGNSNIALLEHQILPIDYLHKNPDLKGILVNHYMGTGKTYLGIGFAQSFPEWPVIILAPKFLESHWKNQIAEYGVTNPERFTFVSYEDAPNRLSQVDISKYILLADEVHNLVKKMRSPDQEQNERYTALYSSLRKAHKILGLSGTPIYDSDSDIAFIVNLVSGKNLMPFNQEEFRLEYTQIIASRQFFRGYLTESNLIVSFAPTVIGVFFGAIFGPFGMIGGAVAGASIPVINSLYDPNTFRLRKLDAEKMRPILGKYVSYFRFDESKFKDFPAQEFEVKQVPYNRKQYSFFLRLVEGDLPVHEVQRLLKNSPNPKTDEFVEINSSVIHEQIYSTIGAGRDIGNFEFLDKDGAIIEPPKFVKVYEDLVKNNEQTMIYSNFFETGILAFESFLKRKNYTERYATISPNLSVSEVDDIVKKYNNGEVRLLLLHPDVTEGISLKGTQNVHILEPMLNSTVLEQVIGRARRFQSHNHLPKEKQIVKVKMWQSTSSAWDLDNSEIRRANWFKRYRELDYLSRWGLGLWQVDKKIDRKILNPEELALLKLSTLKNNLSAIENVLKTESIEGFYGK